MHPVDRGADEYEAGIDALESSDEFEMLGESDEYEEEWAGEDEAVFDEVEEMELAAELLGLQSEEELDQFLGNLIKSAGRAIGGFARSPAGSALGGVLKSVAQKALPVAGMALGNLVVPGLGGAAGAQLASAAGRAFGLELEGMSAQDQEFEVARRFVRLAGAATRQAARTPLRGSPVTAAKDAVLAAAATHAPGLARRRYPGPRRGNGGRPRCNCGRNGGGGQAQGGGGSAQGGGGGGCRPVPGRRGRWVRRGNRIVLDMG